MKYLLDTNIVSALIDETNTHYNNVVKVVSYLNDDDKLYISILTLFEFEYSCFSCSDTEKQKSIKSTIDKINTIFNKIKTNESEAKIFGEIRALIKNKKGINAKNMKTLNFDITIASSAISNSCIVVSGDKIFKTISEIYP